MEIPISNASRNIRPYEAPISALRQMVPLLAAPVGLALVVACALVWAEERRYWLVAQACVVTICLLLSLVVWVWCEQRNKHPHLSVRAHVYHRAIHKLLLCLGIGITGLILNGIRYDRWVNGLVAQAVGYSILFAGFAFISGVMLGYLFGLRPSGTTTNSDGKSSSAVPSSNLEEIADWLTKLILGAGLVTLTKLPDPIFRFASFMAKGVDPMPPAKPPPVEGNPAIVLAILGFFSTCGLLYGYLWTRYEVALTSDAMGVDTSALALVLRWFSAPNKPDDRTRAEMMNAIQGASSAAHMRILQQTEQYRKSSSQDVNDRSLAVLQALVEADPQEVYHRNRSEYAFALMGKTRDPMDPENDWNRALILLNDAIRIRDRLGEKGRHDYELARAVCQIHLDANFKKGQPSNLQDKQLVTADLGKAMDVPAAVQEIIDKAHAIADWKHQNAAV
jgi:hypothetical protein